MADGDLAYSHVSGDAGALICRRHDLTGGGAILFRRETVYFRHGISGTVAATDYGSDEDADRALGRIRERMEGRGYAVSVSGKVLSFSIVLEDTSNRDAYELGGFNMHPPYPGVTSIEAYPRYARYHLGGSDFGIGYIESDFNMTSFDVTSKSDTSLSGEGAGWIDQTNGVFGTFAATWTLTRIHNPNCTH